jgi:energy-coupling factor transporter transmembrane protein EcfT
MKTETFFWIIIGLFALIAILGLIFILKDKEKIGKRLLKSSGYSILFIFIFIIRTPGTQNYVLHNDQELWKEYGLPQIDSCMFLEFNTDKFLSYSSWCKDSVSHFRKWIEYDIFDIYSIKDVFINKKESKTLTYYFVKPNLLRDSSLIVTINNDTISKMQGDLILKDWGIYKRAYHVYFDR